MINFFSLPADDECLSDDGRRIGTCMNVYECRIQGSSNGTEVLPHPQLVMAQFLFPAQAEHLAAIVL